jgi:hypothetical protein
VKLTQLGSPAGACFAELVALSSCKDLYKSNILRASYAERPGLGKSSRVLAGLGEVVRSRPLCVVIPLLGPHPAPPSSSAGHELCSIHECPLCPQCSISVRREFACSRAAAVMTLPAAHGISTRAHNCSAHTAIEDTDAAGLAPSKHGRCVTKHGSGRCNHCRSNARSQLYSATSDRDNAASGHPTASPLVDPTTGCRVPGEQAIRRNMRGAEQTASSLEVRFTDAMHAPFESAACAAGPQDGA